MKEYYGNYLGLCINNDDPQKRGRVQVFVPHIMPSLFENWNEAGEDIKMLCVGDNIPDSIPSTIVEKLTKMLPWAEAASPILGTSSPGNLITQAAGAVAGAASAVAGAVGSFFNQSPVSIPVDGTVGPANIFSPTAAPTPEDRSRVRSNGGIIINLDTNSTADTGKQGPQSGPLVVIPDNATPIERQQAQAYATAISQAYAAKFGSSLPGQVLTRSQNGRGRNNTIHTEPYSVNDVKAVEYFTKTEEGRQVIATITNNTLNRIPGAVFALPHGGVGGKDQGAIGPLSSEVDNARVLLNDLTNGFFSTGNNQVGTGYESTSNSGSASTFNSFSSLNPQNVLDANGTLAGSFVQPTVEPSQGSVVRTTSVNNFVANNDGNTRVDVGLSSTYQPRTASGIPNDSEILGYTIPLNASLKEIAKDASGNQVARLFQPAIVTFKDSSGKEYRVLAVGNDTGGRQVGGNALQRDWGEFGTNTYRALQTQGMNVSLAKNSLGLPQGTTATYQFLDGEVRTVEQYRALQQQLVQNGQLDPSQVSTPIDNGSAAVASQSGIPNTSSMVNNIDHNGPTAVLNINNMAKGIFTYPAAGALLWVFFREGNPLFPVYFAASYGEREWQSAFRQGSDTPGYKPQATKENPIVSTGTVANFGVGGWKVEDTTDPNNPTNNQKSFMVYGHDGSNMFFNEGYHQIFSKFDRRDQVDGDRFNSTLGIKEELVQSDSNSIVMGDQIVKVGNISPSTIEAAKNIQSMVNEIMQPLSQSNNSRPKPKPIKNPNNNFVSAAIKSAQKRFQIPTGPFEVPAQVFKDMANKLVSLQKLKPTPEETQERIDTADINAIPIVPPTPPSSQ